MKYLFKFLIFLVAIIVCQKPNLLFANYVNTEALNKRGFKEINIPNPSQSLDVAPNKLPQSSLLLDYPETLELLMTCTDGDYSVFVLIGLEGQLKAEWRWKEMKSRSGEVSIIRFKKTCTDGFKSTSEDGYSMNLTGSSYSHQLGRIKFEPFNENGDRISTFPHELVCTLQDKRRNPFDGLFDVEPLLCGIYISIKRVDKVLTWILI